MVKSEPPDDSTIPPASTSTVASISTNAVILYRTTFRADNSRAFIAFPGHRRYSPSDGAGFVRGHLSQDTASDFRNIFTEVERLFSEDNEFRRRAIASENRLRSSQTSEDQDAALIDWTEVVRDVIGSIWPTNVASLTGRTANVHSGHISSIVVVGRWLPGALQPPTFNDFDLHFSTIHNTDTIYSSTSNDDRLGSQPENEEGEDTQYSPTNSDDWVRSLFGSEEGDSQESPSGVDASES